MSIRLLMLLMLLSIFTSCIEEFTPELENYDNIVVVDGRISNLPGPYTIKLNYSSQVNTGRYLPISNAIVVIVEKDGPREILTEVEAGVYRSKEGGIKGKVGKEYKILITLPNNKKYETNYTELKKPVNISAIKSSLETRVLEEENNEVIGYQFYVDTEDFHDEEDYLVWFLNGVYKFETELYITDIYSGAFRIPRRSDTLRTCFVQEDINFVYTGSKGRLNSLNDKPIVFIPANDDRLKIRYSLLVNQYTVDKKAYEYWTSVKKIIELGGSLYSFQPYQLKGNVYRTSDAEEPVLGYFLVASIDSKRIYVNKPSEYQVYRTCKPDTYMIWLYIAISDSADWPIYLSLTDDGEKGIASGKCIDCTSIEGANLRKPDFWID